MPHQGGSNEYPQSMFLSRKKNNVYPCKPQFYYIKVRFKGVKIIYVCFRDVTSTCNNASSDMCLAKTQLSLHIHSEIIRIHHECTCRIGKSHPRDRNFNWVRGLPSKSLVEIPTPWVRFPYLHGPVHDGFFFSHL